MRATQVTSAHLSTVRGDVLIFESGDRPNWVARTPAGHDIEGKAKVDLAFAERNLIAHFYVCKQFFKLRY